MVCQGGCGLVVFVSYLHVHIESLEVKVVV